MFSCIMKEILFLLLPLLYKHFLEIVKKCKQSIKKERISNIHTDKLVFFVRIVHSMLNG